MKEEKRQKRRHTAQTDADRLYSETRSPKLLLKRFMDAVRKDLTIAAAMDSSCDAREFLEDYLKSGIAFPPIEDIITKTISEFESEQSRKELEDKVGSNAIPQQLIDDLQAHYDLQIREFSREDINEELSRMVSLAIEPLYKAKWIALKHLLK